MTGIRIFSLRRKQPSVKLTAAVKLHGKKSESESPRAELRGISVVFICSNNIIKIDVRHNVMKKGREKLKHIPLRATSDSITFVKSRFK